MIVDVNCDYHGPSVPVDPSVSRDGNIIGVGDSWRSIVLLRGLLMKLCGPFILVCTSIVCTCSCVLVVLGYQDYSWCWGIMFFMCLKSMLVQTRGVYQTWGNADTRRCLTLDLETKLFRRLPMKTGSSLDLWEMPTSDVVWRRSLRFRHCQLATSLLVLTIFAVVVV